MQYEFYLAAAWAGGKASETYIFNFLNIVIENLWFRHRKNLFNPNVEIIGIV